MNFSGTSGDDNLSGTSGNDVFYMGQGGNDTVDGGDGNDTFRFGGTFNGADSVDGGTGTDKLILDGDYSSGLFINSTILSNVEKIVVSAGHSYALTLFDGVIANGQSLTVDGTAIGADDQLTVDGGYLTGASANTTLIVNGGAGTTYFTGGPGNNTFQGGSSTDFVYFGNNFDSHDKIDGGGGTNYLQLNGDFSRGVTFTAAMMQNFQVLEVDVGNSYRLILNDANVGASQTLEVTGSGLSADESLIFNGSHETDGNFFILGGAGDDILTGGAQNDNISSGSGNDRINGGGGDDMIQAIGNLTSLDRIDGGSGIDSVELGGDYSGGLTFKAATMVNVENLYLDQGSYKLTMNDGNVAAGQALFIDGESLGSSDILIVNAAHETDGSYTITGGDGDDILTGGQHGNTLQGGAGQDQLTGGAGADTFVYYGSSESTGVTRDIVTGFDAMHDGFDLPGTVGAIDTAVTSGVLGAAHFDTNLAVAIDAAHLGAGDAVLFTPDTGSLHGHTFLVVDMNGVAGYQAGADLVIELQNATHMDSFSTGNFI